MEERSPLEIAWDEFVETAKKRGVTRKEYDLLIEDGELIPKYEGWRK